MMCAQAHTFCGRLMTSLITLVVAAPDSLVLAGCRSFLRERRDLDVLAECTTFGAALKALKRHRPQVLLVDGLLCGSDPTEACLRLLRASPQTAIAWLARARAKPPAEDLEERVSAILPPSVTPDQLSECVTTVAAGRRWRPSGDGVRQSPASRPVEHLPRGRSPLRLLTLRERQIVQGVASGLRNREIGAALGITAGTVKLHLHKIYVKLGVNSRLELFRKLVREAQARS
jgi:DNA-binding NarL/FixJ family response regulator